MRLLKYLKITAVMLFSVISMNTNVFCADGKKILGDVAAIASRVSNGSDSANGLQGNPFKRCPENIKFYILERAVLDNNYSFRNAGILRLVCKDWQHVIERGRMKKSIELIIYQIFLKGVLIYRPDQESDVGQIDMPIAALANPLGDTFDLSRCGDTSKYLSISTGYRKAKKAENDKKIEIWLAPRFLIQRELTTTAGHFKSIEDKWGTDAGVGIFWNWGGWDNLALYDYLISQNMENLANNNLYEKWSDAPYRPRCGGFAKNFFCVFC